MSLYGTPGTAGQDTITLHAPDRPEHIFAWRLTETRDTFGNRIQYLYTPDPSPSAGPVGSSQLYLSEIRYGDIGDPDEDALLVSVRFIYTPRPDILSEHRAGFEIRTTQRCTRMDALRNVSTKRARCG